MFAGLVRYDECERGMVEHAIRIIVKHTRREYLYPANHHASVPSTNDPDVPVMGQRLRLKSSFVIPDHWTTHEKAVLKALKKYGVIVADNGNFLSISVAPDDRFPEDAFAHLSSIGVGEFEVIQSTGPTEGPRSPGAPTAHAGPDLTVAPNQPLQLQGFVAATLPPTIEWRAYAGNTAVEFDDATKTNTVVTFSPPGNYTLMLSADDGVHAVAYDAVIVQVTDVIQLRATQAGANIQLDWSGGNAPFEIESTLAFPTSSWVPVLTTDARQASIPAANDRQFFRVRAATP